MAGEEVLLLACSDGAGSASRSEVGSRLACETVLAAAAAWIGQGNTPADVQDAHMEDWFLEAIHRIADEAAHLQTRPRELACTLLFGMVGDSRSAFAQLGDGAIVIATGEDYTPVFWPQSGEYANQTYFVTDQETLTRVQYDRFVGPIDEVALFTDGIQSLALHFATQSAHSPFFRPFFARLRQEPPGERNDLSRSLARFLDSPRVNERSDDDKTLLLATRRFALPVAPSFTRSSAEAEQPAESERPLARTSLDTLTGDEPPQAD